MGNIIQGSDLMAFMGGKSLAFATGCKLSINAETTETSHKDIGGDWTSETVKKLNWSVTSDNLYSEEGYSSLFDAMIAKQPIALVFATQTATADDEMPAGGWAPKANSGYSGQALITNIEANAPDGDNATFSVTFKGVGKLAKVTAPQ